MRICRIEPPISANSCLRSFRALIASATVFGTLDRRRAVVPNPAVSAIPTVAVLPSTESQPPGGTVVEAPFDRRRFLQSTSLVSLAAWSGVGVSRGPALAQEPIQRVGGAKIKISL